MFSDNGQWQARRDSNPQLPDLESGALPLELLACRDPTFPVPVKHMKIAHSMLCRRYNMYRVA